MDIKEKYSVYFYTTRYGRDLINDFLSSLDKITENKTRNNLRLLQQYGFKLLYDNTVKKIQRNPELYELRTVGKIQTRLIFIQYDKNTFLIILGYIKKTQKLPIHLLKLANRRAKEFI